MFFLLLNFWFSFPFISCVLTGLHLLGTALVHDLAESIVGDITPYCGVSKEEKKLREMNAMRDIAKLIEPRGDHLMELFEVSAR